MDTDRPKKPGGRVISRDVELMNSTTNICGKCHVSILAETALSTGGLCMPCFKSANNGWTPYDIRYHESNDLSLIANRWKKFQQMKFPWR